jgi:hypothetical protein
LAAVASDDVSPFRAEQGRIEVLMSCQGPRLLWFARAADRARAKRAGVEWTEDLGDPEFTKNLRTLHQLNTHAERLAVRGLAARIALPHDRPLTLEALLAHRFAVEQRLVRHGDEEYLRWRAAALYDEDEGTYVRWRDMYADPPPLLADNPGEDARKATQTMLARLLAAKEAQDLPLRARRELKARVVWLILPLILAATCLFAAALAIVENDVETVLLAAAAGLAGAALGGLLQLRDEITRGAQVREFTPFYAGQLLVGASAGLLVYAADSSGIVEIAGGSAGVAALAFAVGFSEAAFLRLLARVGGEEPRKTEKDPT